MAAVMVVMGVLVVIQVAVGGHVLTAAVVTVVMAVFSITEIHVYYIQF